jgi:putative ABC transport system permease protein
VFKEQLVQIPGAVQASACFGPAGSGSALVLNTVIDDGDEDTPPQEMMLNAIACDSDYIPLFDLQLKEGRNFDDTITSDKSNAVILNEAAVKKFQLDDPLNAELPINGQDQAPSKVIGVVKDFHFRSLRQKITPLMLYQNDRFIQSVVLEYSPDAELAGVISGIQSVWNSQFGSQDFQYQFVDEEYNKLYQAEEKMGKLFIFFSLLIIFVACLGIFGLVSFISEQRTKEIGVRKVLGSSVMQIVTLLTTDFVKWVLVANVVAVPIAWYAVNKWLENFAYRTAVSAWVFVVAGCITMIIALFTIVSQTIHAAQMNPVKTLKYE